MDLWKNSGESLLNVQETKNLKFKKQNYFRIEITAQQAIVIFIKLNK